MTSSMNVPYLIVSSIVSPSMKGSVPRVSPPVVALIVYVSVSSVSAETVAFC